MVAENEFSDAFSLAFDATTALSPDAPCSWPIDYSACGGGLPEPLASLPASGVAVFEEMAATYLWDWTGRKYGQCEVTLRPCRQPCYEGVSTFWGGAGGPLAAPFTPVLIQGAWLNIGCGSCGDTCGCDSTASLRLPGPIASVQQVQIDGEVLSSLAYRVDNGRFLVRTDGGRWPTCQNMNLMDGQEDTWSVTYTKGTAVPKGGQVAAGRLANELAKAACGDKSCGLPQRVQSITRQGVTVAVLDSFDDIDTGHTGIWLIDSWVASVVNRPRKWRVLSPDRMPPRYRQQTWPVT
jgi:hypothetical protein